MSQFDLVAARAKLIAVYPAETGGMPGGGLLMWNAGHCCANARENKIDDVGFISSNIDEPVAAGKADPKRIYVTGMSNGDMMSHRVALELPGKIAAIAPVVGALFGAEAMPKSPPFSTLCVLMLVGMSDPTVQAGGCPLAGDGNRAISALCSKPEDRDTISTRAAADFRATANGCTGPVESSTPAAGTLTYAKCRNGTEVTLVSVANNGHAWPGGRPGRAEAAPRPRPGPPARKCGPSSSASRAGDRRLTTCNTRPKRGFPATGKRARLPARLPDAVSPHP